MTKFEAGRTLFRAANHKRSMSRKLLTTILLLALAIQPGGWAFAMAGTSSHQVGGEHDSIVMDCGQTDSGICFNFGDCIANGHARCDSKSETVFVSLLSVTPLIPVSCIALPVHRYSSRPPELLLRPPRISC